MNIKFQFQYFSLYAMDLGMNRILDLDILTLNIVWYNTINKVTDIDLEVAAATLESVHQ